MKEIELLPGGRPLFTPEEYQKFREEFCEEMERFRIDWSALTRAEKGES